MEIYGLYPYLLNCLWCAGGFLIGYILAMRGWDKKHIPLFYDIDVENAIDIALKEQAKEINQNNRKEKKGSRKGKKGVYDINYKMRR